MRLTGALASGLGFGSWLGHGEMVGPRESQLPLVKRGKSISHALNLRESKAPRTQGGLAPYSCLVGLVGSQVRE